jgi:hypothetical protein
VSFATTKQSSPPAPRILATPYGGTSVRLDWTDQSAVAEYRIEAKEDADGQYREVGATGSAQRSFVVGDLQPLSRYTFRLRSCDAGGCSPHSGEVPATTGALNPETELKGILAGDVTRESVAEGLPSAARFSAAGTIHATYLDDRVDVTLDDSGEARFLVLNEMYSPRWRAFSGQDELKVYPTNVVMRGVVVPAGRSHLEFRYQPVLLTAIAVLIVCGGLGALALGWLFFRRLDRGAEATR